MSILLPEGFSMPRRARIAMAEVPIHIIQSENRGQTNVDPQAWLADLLARINDHSIQRLDQLLPWNWTAALQPAA